MDDKELKKAVEEIKKHCGERNLAVNDLLSKGGQRFVSMEKDIDSLKDWQERQNGSLKEIAGCLTGIRQDINEAKIEAAQGKPSWLVTIILGSLLSVATGLVVYVITLGTC